MRLSKIVPAMLLVIALATGPVLAGGNGFWENLLKKINNLASHRTSHKTYTSVMGVRGAKSDKGTDSLYWKGEQSEAKEAASSQQISENELADFKNAVSLASSGQNDQALEAFKNFVKTYPQSSLNKDALGAIEKLEKSSSPTGNKASAEPKQKSEPAGVQAE